MRKLLLLFLIIGFITVGPVVSTRVGVTVTAHPATIRLKDGSLVSGAVDGYLSVMRTVMGGTRAFGGVIGRMLHSILNPDRTGLPNIRFTLMLWNSPTPCDGSPRR
jgi:hypothetical protein